MNRVVLIAALAVFGGCARISGLPQPGDESLKGQPVAQTRVWCGAAEIKGGNIATPARGAGEGYGCVLTQIGKEHVGAVRCGREGCSAEVPVPAAGPHP